jgi:SAM-dependent methyltransferase
VRIGLSMPKTKAFDDHSDRYDEWFDQHTKAYQAELEAIRRMIPFRQMNGVEVGIGSGRFAAPLGIRIGVEPSEQMAIIAEQKGIRVIRAVAEMLPFSDSEFDFILMVTTICFLDDVLRSFREAFRVLRQNGYIIVGFIDRESELGKQYNSKRESSVFYKDATFYSANEVRQLLEEARFQKIHFRQTLIPATAVTAVRPGFGEGGFVVARGVKNTRRITRL